jgi:hypothetical protein
MRRATSVAGAATLACVAAASFVGMNIVSEPLVAEQHPLSVEITLERQQGRKWTAIDPALVLAPGDIVRFRFKSNFDGYLYVTNLGTSGRYELLFPREETGSANLVQHGKDYLVPATDAHFRIAGPPGYESVFWLVSPVVLGEPRITEPPAPRKRRPTTLLPRCDDTAMRARGLCLDPEAGPHAVGTGDEMPDEFKSVPGAASRDIMIVQQRAPSVLMSHKSSQASAPMLYEFRIAHK